MDFTTIDVDQEVMAFLKSHAEPFVDEPNDVLRKLFLSGKNCSKKKKPREMLLIRPVVPPGIPRALDQILRVVGYMKINPVLTRTQATEEVAGDLGIKIQTIIDKYTRQLGGDVYAFDALMQEDQLKGLREKLNIRFKLHKRVINDFLDQVLNPLKLIAPKGEPV